MLCGKKVMPQITFLPAKIRRENWAQYNFYGTLPETFSSFQVTNPIFPNTIFSSYEHTCTPTIPSGHWLALSLVQHALTIRDSQLCRLRSDVVTCNHVPFWMALT
jgi:hypothetical protein